MKWKNVYTILLHFGLKKNQNEIMQLPLGPLLLGNYPGTTTQDSFPVTFTPGQLPLGYSLKIMSIVLGLL